MIYLVSPVLALVNFQKWVNQGSSDLKYELESKRTKKKCWLIVTKKESMFIIQASGCQREKGWGKGWNRWRGLRGTDSQL